MSVIIRGGFLGYSQHLNKLLRKQQNTTCMLTDGKSTVWLSPQFGASLSIPNDFDNVLARSDFMYYDEDMELQGIRSQVEWDGAKYSIDHFPLVRQGSKYVLKAPARFSYLGDGKAPKLTPKDRKDRSEYALALVNSCPTDDLRDWWARMAESSAQTLLEMIYTRTIFGVNKSHGVAGNQEQLLDYLNQLAYFSFYAGLCRAEWDDQAELEFALDLLNTRKGNDDLSNISEFIRGVKAALA